MSKLNGDDTVLDGVEDLPKALRGPARAHGRKMVALVYGAGMCSEATATLARKAQARQDGEAMDALRVLSQTFNQVSTAYCKLQGWTEAELALCDRDIMTSFAAEVFEGQAGRIVLAQ
jgi:hypothetical protein